LLQFLLHSNYLYISSAYSYDISIKNKKKQQQRSILANSENGCDTTLCRLKIRHTFLADRRTVFVIYAVELWKHFYQTALGNCYSGLKLPKC